MTEITLTVTGAEAIAEVSGPLTFGMVGIPVKMAFDTAWAGLNKTAVFRVGSVSLPAGNPDGDITVPWELMKKTGCALCAGVYGCNAEGTVVIPTVWAECGVILPGTEVPDGAPRPPVKLPWQQVWETIGELAQLDTETKENLVAAINECFHSGSGGSSDHGKLLNREQPGQHPMKAITGLLEALAGKQPAGSYLEQESDPTVPAWAKQAEKPAYTASEVHALPDTTEIPEKLPSPQMITFNGAVHAAYDGSAPVIVEIPSGIPESAASDVGKFLRVDSSGSAKWQTVPNGNGVRF